MVSQLVRELLLRPSTQTYPLHTLLQISGRFRERVKLYVAQPFWVPAVCVASHIRAPFSPFSKLTTDVSLLRLTCSLSDCFVCRIKWRIATASHNNRVTISQIACQSNCQQQQQPIRDRATFTLSSYKQQLCNTNTKVTLSKYFYHVNFIVEILS